MPSECSEIFCIRKRKWFILSVVAGINATNGALLKTFTPISKIAETYFGVKDKEIDWLSNVFFITSIPVGVLATVLCVHSRLGFVIRFAAVTNSIGAVLRYIANAYKISNNSPFLLTITGQTLAAVSQSFLFTIPTFVSERWFPKEQRIIATTVAVMAFWFGIFLENVFSYYLITKFDHAIQVVNTILAFSAVIFAFCANVISLSKPQIPPSRSADVGFRTLDYLTQIKSLINTRSYVILLLTSGLANAVIYYLHVLLEKFFCTAGYTHDFANLCGNIAIGVGIFGAIVSAIIIKKINYFEEVSKIIFALSALSVSSLVTSLHVNYNYIFVAISCALLGFFMFANIPLMLELAAEVTFPVSEALSAGFVIMWSHFQAIILISLSGLIGKTIPFDKRKIKTCSVNMAVPIYCVASVFVFAVCGFILLFKADYKRMNHDNQVTTPARNESVNCDEESPLNQSVEFYG